MIRRILTFTLVLAAAAGALVLTGASDEEVGKRYQIVLDNAFGLVEGGELKVGGVKAGAIRDFRLTETNPKRVIVEVETNVEGLDSLRSDARCDVRQQSLIGEYFLDCTLGESRRRLPDNGTVPVEQTSSTIPPDLIANVMRRPYRERWRIFLSELGTGLAGRPEELNEVIRRAHPALRETSETFRILAEQNRTLANFIRDADRVSAAVEPAREDLARWARESADYATAQAARAREYGDYFNRLPRFLAELEPTARQLEATATRQTPALREIGAGADELRDFLATLEPFARESRGSLRALGRAGVAGREAIRESRQEVAELRELSENAPRLARPLRQFLQAIDDRDRSIEDDPLAERLAPPAPDKTAYRSGQGFTGMEALFNYVYWQTLGINAFDELGHLLRIVTFATPCTVYQTNPTRQVAEECGSALGPTQPGVFTPDPTVDGTAAREQAERRNPSRRNRTRRPGEPEAPPLPGRRDPSEPQIVLPDAVRDLLESLNGIVGGNAPSAPGLSGDGPAPTQLLDYLLAP